MERLGELSFSGCIYCCSVSLYHFTVGGVLPVYWPADNTKGVQRYGEFTVSVLQTTKQEDGFIQRNISITNPKVTVLGEFERD